MKFAIKTENGAGKILIAMKDRQPTGSINMEMSIKAARKSETGGSRA
ncbi:MAG: hypothetical protein AB2693_15950 [Candidatus Thiodiazotropha sp.]